MVGTTLTSIGMADNETATIVAAIPLVVGLAVDLAYSALAQKKGWK